MSGLDAVLFASLEKLGRLFFSTLELPEARNRKKGDGFIFSTLKLAESQNQTN